MALEIIGAGYGRTGTASTWAALKQLGFPCYHMFEVTRNRANVGHREFWLEVGQAPDVPHDWDRVFAGYTATVDFPGSCVWKQLLAANPDAKVLMTLHPKGAGAWYDSVMETIYFTQNRWFFAVMATVMPIARTMRAMSRLLIWDGMMRGTMRSRDAAMAEYQRHLDEVVATVPADRLLVFTADQGWEPLCAFLAVPVPETPFPNVNDRAEFTRMFKGMKIAASVILAVGAVVVAGVVYGAVRLFG
jgi:hypothetical protein